MENKNKLIILIVSISSFLLVGIACVFAFFQINGILPAKKILKNISNVKTFSYSGFIKASLRSSDPKDADINGDMDVSVSGDMDVSDDNASKGNMYFELKSNVANNPIPYLSYNMVYNSKDVSYLKIKDLSFQGLDLKEINNKWIKIDAQSLISLFGTSNSSPSILSSSINKQQEDQLEKLILKSNFLKFVEKKSNQMVDGLNMDYYSFSIEEDNFIKFILGADGILNPGKGSITYDGLKGVLNETKFNKIGVWVNKSDYLPYKISLDVKVKEGYVNFDMNFKNFNKTVNVQIPSDFKTLEDVISQILQSSYGNNQINSNSVQK